MSFRESFAVTDPEIDAPDGAVIEMEDGVWERVGSQWRPRHTDALRAHNHDSSPEQTMTTPPRKANG